MELSKIVSGFQKKGGEKMNMGKLQNIEMHDGCPSDKNGTWICSDCDLVLENMISTWTHVDLNPTHKLVWLCWEHGFERTNGKDFMTEADTRQKVK